MSASAPIAAGPWASVLAGGDGTRMQQLIRLWLAQDRPKQYCTFVGHRSMLWHTYERASRVVPPERTVTIIGGGHYRYLEGSAPALPGSVIEQPANCGTAAGVFLSLTFIIDRDPEATVLILPSDHFIHPRDRFEHYLRFAELVVQQHPDRLLLFGARPDSPETDYGWIVPGERAPTWVSHRFVPAPQRVVSFCEKPAQQEARRLCRAGGLWNTMIVAAKVRTIWELGWMLLPEMMTRFETLRQVVRAVHEGRVGPEHQARALQHIYRGLQPADLSRDILQQVTGTTLVLPLDGIEWSDWGRPERVIETLQRLGKRPCFPEKLVAAVSAQAGEVEARPGPLPAAGAGGGLPATAS